MKKNLLLISLVFCICSGKSQSSDSGSFVLRGKIIGKDTGYIYLWYRGTSGVVSDSFHLRGGEFIFKGDLREPVDVIFSTFNFASKNRAIYDSKKITIFYIEPGQMNLLAIIDSFRELHLEGSKPDSDRVRLQRMKDTVELRIQPVMQEYDVLMPIYNAEFIKNPKPKSFKLLKRKMDSIHAVLDPLYAKEARIDSAFIVDNPASYVAANMLLGNVRGGATDQFPDIKKLYDKFPPNIKESSYGKSISDIMESESAIHVGSEAVDFVALNRQGDTVRLIDFKDKQYVLLDFWASWCEPCRDITPALIKINAKYKEKIHLISIANHDKESDWLAAIKKDQMSWMQILDNDSSRIIVPATGSITDAYYINVIPSLILIDKNHKICKLFGNSGKNRSSIESLDNEIEKILQ
jgi:thiol-disulfide isomerase/thioredoxin